jgi:glucan 1,4-alpha-glucosidase
MPRTGISVRLSNPGRVPRTRRACAVAATLATAAATVLIAAAPAAHAATASGGPGSASSWNEPLGTQGYATAVSSASKVWYMLGSGELTDVFYPETDNPDTFGLQYYVTDGSSFTDNEVSNTTHAITLADPDSLTWTQTNTATSGKYTITKTYVADPARSVILIDTTFTNKTSTPLNLYADYLPQLDNEGAGNSGSTDATSGDLVAQNGPVASALTSSVGFTTASTGYVGTSSSGESQLTSGYALSSPYSAASSAGHLDQTAQIPVAATGSTTFTLALAFDTTEAAAISDAATSLSTGFTSVESSFQTGWHAWNSGLNAPPNSVTGSGLTQYEVSLMEVKADEDKTYVGGFVASPSTPWGSSDSADGGSGQSGQHGYHLVWTRDEYEMASALLAAGDTTDANAALTYIFTYEEESSGQVKQNTWLNGNTVFGSNQQDEEADPIILAYQLGRTDASDYTSYIEPLAKYIASNGPTTQEERWEENGGYSPATISAEIAGLICASTIATDNGDSADAASWLALAKTWASDVAGWTYTTTGPYGNGDYFLRITPDGQANSGASISVANGGGSHDDRTVVDQSFLELVRLGILPATSAEITNSLAVTDAEIGVQLPEGQIDHRYDFDGYGETSSTGANWTGSGSGNPWPVLTGERGEYDVADGNLSGAASALATMAGAAANYQISEQVWAGANGVNGFTTGKPDNSATPLMWAMAQYVRLAINISAGTDTDTPQVVCQTFSTCSTASKTAPPAPTNLTVTGTKINSVSLSWSGNALATGYQVYRSTAGGTATLVTTTTNNSYTDTGLSSTTAYTYYIVAVNGYGSSPDSASVTASTLTPGPPPAAPTGLISTAIGMTSVSLAWNSATDANGTVAGYDVYRSTGTGAATLVGTTSTSTVYTDSSVAASTTYKYYVTAFDTAGNMSAASNTLSVTTAAAPVLPAISAVSPTSASAGTQVTVTGTGFGATQGSGYLTFSDDGTNWGAPPDTATFTLDSWSNTAITFTVPTPSGSSGQFAVVPGSTATITVTDSVGTSNTEDLAITAGPTPAISAISPTSASAGTQVTLTGTNFGTTQGSSYVAFSDNGTNWGAPGDSATFTVDSWSSTAITFTVPTPSGSSGQWAVVPGSTATVKVSVSGQASNTENLPITAATSTGSVTETFDVTVPAGTPSTGQVYLAGNLSVLGEGQSDWAANGVLMTKVSSTLWTVTLTAAAPATLQYKYVLNGTWSNNEETSSCAYVANRSVNVDNGTENDTVANWEGYGGC